MKLIKDIEVRYNIRVKKILEMDMQMGLYTGWNSDVSGMCREMLGCMCFIMSMDMQWMDIIEL